MSRLKLILLALFSLLLGLGLVIYPFVVFGYVVWALPYLAAAAGLIRLAAAWQLKQKRRKYIFKAFSGVILLVAGVILFVQGAWRDAALWYLFAGYLAFSAVQTVRPALQPGVEKQSFARWIGSLTTLAFVLLMIIMPRSGLSDALRMLGVFTAAWGFYQLLLPVQK